MLGMSLSVPSGAPAMSDGAMSDGPGPGAPAESAEQQAARAAAYEASIMASFGGKRGLAEVGLPSVLFVLVYAISKRLDAALWAALVAAGVLTAARLVKKDTLQHSLGGLAGVLVCAAVAKFTGQAKDFYLPGLLLNVGEAVLFGVSAALRWPVVGVMLGPVTGEMMAWREHPSRLRAFTQATLLLAAMFLVRVVIEVPLYLANATNALGVAKIVLGYPLYLAVAYVCWQIIRRAPLPAVKPAVDESASAGTAEDAASADSDGDAASSVENSALPLRSE